MSAPARTLVHNPDVDVFLDTMGYDEPPRHPVVTTGDIDPRYVGALLLELDRRGVQVWTLDTYLGLTLLSGNNKMNVSARSLDEAREALWAFAAELETGNAHSVLHLDLPDEALKSPEWVSVLNALSKRIHQRSISARLVTSRFESEWSTPLELSPPRGAELMAYMDRVLEKAGVVLEESLRARVGQNLKGLSSFDIEAVLTSATARGGESRELVERIERLRRERLSARSGIELIECEPVESMGGMDELKRYLERDAAIFARCEQAHAEQVDLPKGLLLVGLPGCGKSLAARVAAGVLDLPLLRMDMGSLMGKYLGESEKRLSRALASVEAIAPCVLWIDEIEKALGGAGDGRGTATDSRMFASMLTWMQEQKEGVYLIATANAVSKLPPELLRRGRFDESFFVGLPNERERANILKIHLKKRGLEHDIEVTEPASKATEGFSGAELEALVKAVHRDRFVHHHEGALVDDLKQTASSMTPFSQQWADRMDVLERPLREQGFRNVSSSGKPKTSRPVTNHSERAGAADAKGDSASGPGVEATVVKIDRHSRDGLHVTLEMKSGQLKRGQRLSVIRQGRARGHVRTGKIQVSPGGIRNVVLLYNGGAKDKVRPQDILTTQGVVKNDGGTSRRSNSGTNRRNGKQQNATTTARSKTTVKADIIRVEKQYRESMYVHLRVFSGRIKKGQRLNVVRGGKVRGHVYVDDIQKSAEDTMHASLRYGDKSMAKFGFGRKDALESP
jgi:hypothetical protein